MRPARSAFRIRRVTRSTSPTTTASSASGDRGERPSALCAPNVRRRLRTRTGRGSQVVCQRVQVPAGGPPEQGDERRLAERGDLADGREARPVEPLRGRGPHAPEPLHLERVQEGELGPGRDHEQPVRLGHAAGHLGQVLGGGHPDGDRQADPLADLTPQAHRDLRGRPRDPLHPADVEEGLVDREPLDQRRGPLEDVEHRPAGRDVGGPPGRHDHGLRAQPPRPPAAHRPLDAVRAGLVARRQHDPRPDDHRPAPQGGVVALLDGREEGVEVGVQDRRLARHEHMFAHRPDGRHRRRRLRSPRRPVGQRVGDHSSTTTGESRARPGRSM